MTALVKKLLFIGDSLIEFFDWQGHFLSHSVINLGRAGETVEELLSRLQRIITDHPSLDMIFIMTGINNLAMEDLDFLNSYRKILEVLVAAYPHAGLFAHSLLPTLLPWISNASIEEVNRLLAQTAKDNGVNYIDLYQRFIDEKGVVMKDYLQSDGIHLSEKGYAVWTEIVEEIIEL